MTRTSRARSVVRLSRLALLLVGAVAMLLVACGGDDAPAAVNVVVASESTATAAPAPTEEPRATSTPTEAPATPTPAPVRTATPAATAATPRAAAPAVAPTSGRWIDVDVSRYVVRLMDGQNVMRQIGPVAVGVQVNTGAYASTQTGLFHVYTKNAALTYDAPYDTYIAWWVGFDPAKDNGFHSFLADAKGNVVDGSTGRVSNGCIRTGEPDVIYNFATIGMPVFVHL